MSNSQLFISFYSISGILSIIIFHLVEYVLINDANYRRKMRDNRMKAYMCAIIPFVNTYRALMGIIIFFHIILRISTSTMADLFIAVYMSVHTIKISYLNKRDINKILKIEKYIFNNSIWIEMVTDKMSDWLVNKKPNYADSRNSDISSYIDRNIIPLTDKKFKITKLQKIGYLYLLALCMEELNKSDKTMILPDLNEYMSVSNGIKRMMLTPDNEKISNLN